MKKTIGYIVAVLLILAMLFLVAKAYAIGRMADGSIPTMDKLNKVHNKKMHLPLPKGATLTAKVH